MGKPGAAIQGMITTESFVTKTGFVASEILKRQLIYVSGGKIFVTDLTGDPVLATVVGATGRNAFNASYDSESTDVTLQPRKAAPSSQVVEAQPDGTGGDLSSHKIFADAAQVEMAVMKHVGRADEIASGQQRATVVLTLSDVMNVNDTFTLTDTAGLNGASSQVTKTYTAKAAEGATATNQEFEIGGSAAGTATNIANMVNSSNGHNGSIIAEASGATVTFTQRVAGLAGNTTVAETSSEASFGTATFTGGEDTAPHNYVYMTDGTKYVKVDVSQSPAIVSQWIGPYKTVQASQGGTVFRAKLVQQFGARLVLAGVDPTPTNWFLSKITDPFDWTPGAGTTAGVEALAGTAGTKFGTVGDNIKALIPVGTNSLVFGCTSSLVMLTGDPAFDNVVFRQISRTVGVLGPRAFTPINEMSSLIASTEGVFAIDPNTFDIEKGARITKDRLDNLFSRLDFENTSIVMGYDDARSTALMCVTKTDDDSSSEIFALDMSNGGWWLWQIANSSMRGVKSVVSFRPVDGDRTAPLLGTESGHLLSQPESFVQHQDGGVLSSTTFSTVHPPVADAVDFDSEVLMGPINADPSRRVLLKDTRVLLGEKSESDVDTVTTGPFLSILTGDTAQEAIGFASGFTLATTNVNVDGGDEAGGTDAQDTSLLGVACDGGDEAGGTDAQSDGTVFGGVAGEPDGQYTPQSTGTLINDTVFAGPGGYTVSRNTDGKWEIKEGGVVYFQTSTLVSGTPTTIQYLSGLLPTSVVATITGSQFRDAQATSNVLLSRGRSTAKRTRIRASDVFIKIGATSRAWALEDLSVDVEDGGPVRSVS
tara:strand:- start:10301 stop:12763 length:2463 start_codon:yes stop_codon:yes gene_type:complete